MSGAQRCLADALQWDELEHQGLVSGRQSVALFELDSHFTMVTKRAISDLLFWQGPPSFFCLLIASLLIRVFQETSITIPDRDRLLSSK